MQILKAIVDTQRTNTTIGYVNTGDVVKLNLQVISNGEIGDNWVNPVIELHGIKSDKKRVRQTDNIQIVDLANHHLEITLHEQFMTCDGLVRLQLVIKDDGGRISSSVFYLRVTKSLEMGVMESHDYIQVFDDFDTYMELVKEFEAKMKEDITLLEAELQKASDLSQSISNNEAERQKAFEMNESNREVQFNASQSSQTSTFTTNEAERQKGETQRVTNENARQTAERNREVRMAELETKTSELIEKADEQVLKVDEFINTNTKRLLEEDARKDYMGNECHSIRETMNSNVDYAVKTAIGEFNYLDYEGQHITANHSIEGHVKSAILKGNTLVNVFPSVNDDRFLIENSTTLERLEDGFLRVNAPHNGRWQIATNTIPIKPSTNYLLITEVKNNTVDGRITLANVTGFTTNNLTKVDIGFNGVLKQIITTLDVLEDYIFQGWLDSGTTGFVDIRNVLIEYQEGMENWDIPYFEGMQSVRMPVLTTTGKNLFNADMLTYGGSNYTGSAQYVPDTSNFTRAVLKQNNLIEVKPNSTLTLSCDSRFKLVIQEYDENEIRTMPHDKGWQTNGYHSLTVGANTKKVNLYFVKQDPYSATNITSEEFEVLKNSIQLEEGSVVTSYEPYKSNILTANEEVELRGIGEVQDELNLLTGELTQHIGEVVLDGSEEYWGLNALWSGDGTDYCCFYNSEIKQGKIAKVLGSDKLIAKSSSELRDSKTGLAKSEGIRNDIANVQIFLAKSKLTTVDVDGLKQYLQSNPITVQYQFATESIKTVDLSDNVVYSYDEVTHYDGSSEDGSLIPTVAVKVPTDVNAVISSQRATIQEQTEQINTLEKENALLTEQNEKQDVDIALNQDAINFMLFEVMGLSNDDANKLNPMSIYFANQILKGKLTYTQVIGKYPQFKDDIDSCLLAEGRSDLIVKID